MGDPPGYFLGGRVGNRQQNAVFPGKDPSLGAESRDYLLFARLHANQRMGSWQQHVVVEFLDNLVQVVPEGDEIYDITVFIKRSTNLCLDSVVVTMQTLANVTSESNEVSSTEDQLLFVKQNTVTLRGRFQDEFLDFKGDG